MPTGSNTTREFIHCSEASVGAAPADQREMGGVDGESVPGRDRIGQAVQIVERDVDRETADFTREMVVLDMVGEMQHGRTVTQMDMMHQSGLLERVDRPIHR